MSMNLLQTILAEDNVLIHQSVFVPSSLYKYTEFCDFHVEKPIHFQSCIEEPSRTAQGNIDMCSLHLGCHQEKSISQRMNGL